MRGEPEVGSISTTCKVEVQLTGWRGRLSIPQHGTQFTETYPTKEDATAALVDLRREVYGANVSEAALPTIQ